MRMERTVRRGIALGLVLFLVVLAGFAYLELTGFFDH